MAADTVILDQTGRYAADYLIFGSVRHTSGVFFRLIEILRRNPSKVFNQLCEGLFF